MLSYYEYIPSKTTCVSMCQHVSVNRQHLSCCPPLFSARNTPYYIATLFTRRAGVSRYAQTNDVGPQEQPIEVCATEQCSTIGFVNVHLLAIKRAPCTTPLTHYRVSPRMPFQVRDTAFLTYAGGQSLLNVRPLLSSPDQLVDNIMINYLFLTTSICLLNRV